MVTLAGIQFHTASEATREGHPLRRAGHRCCGRGFQSPQAKARVELEGRWRGIWLGGWSGCRHVGGMVGWMDGWMRLLNLD